MTLDCGGGAGGGLGRPGTGLVVDFVASIARQSSAGGGGGGGGSSSRGNTIGPLNTNEVTAPRSSVVASGDDVKSTIDIQGSEQNLELLFDSISTGGTVTVQDNEPLDVSGLFDSVQTGATSSHGTLTVDGTNSTTISNVYDIDTSEGFVYDSVDVTLPYNESLILAFGHSENNMRFLHYNGLTWEDRTTGIDTQANTVTGTLDSLSPVVVAVLEDGTFDALYLQVHPLDGVVVEDASFLAPQAGAAIGEEIDVGAAVKIL